MDEREIERIMRQDLSKGTEKFRDALLARCLAVLGSEDGMLLDDSELELLAAELAEELAAALAEELAAEALELAAEDPEQPAKPARDMTSAAAIAATLKRLL